MQSKDKVLDDIARMAGGAVSIMSGLTKQAREEIRVRVEEFATRLDLVPRDEFERLEAVLQETRRMQERLVKRIESLEKKPAQNPAGKKKAAPKSKRGKSRS
ncbi:MAG: accessory factor UbiK family protein [Alphaproteobacteria bacterium]|nr:accessory factor UbiK family protein [Alphaproteobacteria bacterium]